jgi:hypothetical protein
VGVGVAASGLPTQAKFFADASANVHDQQIEVGRRLAVRMPTGASVLVGDAGAIPYVSGRNAVDALGLGGYHGRPFARAGVAGEGATIELIERMPARERPGYMALYPNWFGGITTSFGHEVDRVSLTQNFVCGGITKVIYEADWSALADDATSEDGDGARFGTVVEALDVADIESERDHAYESPAPLGGWTAFDVRLDAQGAKRFDAGRTIREGQSERFTLREAAREGSSLVVRTDDSDAEVRAEVTRAGVVVEQASVRASGKRGRHEAPGMKDDPRVTAHWVTRRAPFANALAVGDRVNLLVERGTFRDYHVWIVTDGTDVTANP